MTETYLICRYCRYATLQRSSIISHNKTKKHKLNRQKDIPLPSENEFLIIILENDKRKAEMSAEKNLNTLINL